MNDLGPDLIESLGEALEHAKGNKTGARVTRIEVPDVRALREGGGRRIGDWCTCHRCRTVVDD